MSITVDYFFNFTSHLAAVVEQINFIAGCQLAPYEGDASDFYSRFLGMELSLTEHDFENDHELVFENYQFHLSLRTSAGASRLRPMQIPAMVCIAQALSVELDIAGMLVFDGQILLARYQSQIDPRFGNASLYDTLSGAFVNLPAHFNELIRRLPEGWL